MAEQLTDDFKRRLYHELDGRGLCFFAEKHPDGNESQYWDFVKFEHQLGFQRIWIDENCELRLQSEKINQARGLYSYLTEESALRLCQHGWTLITDFGVRGTGVNFVWPKNGHRLAHRREEDNQRESDDYPYSLPPATVRFINFWIEAQKEGRIRQYADDADFQALVDDMNRKGLIDEADFSQLDGLRRARIAQGLGTYRALNPCPILILKREMSELSASEDTSRAADLVLNELQFLFDALGFRLNDFLGSRMNIKTESKAIADESLGEYIRILQYKRQIVLQGPPGTGKTFMAKNVAEVFLTGNLSSDKKLQREILSSLAEYKLVQFHPSYTYEDFVRGIEVTTDSSGGASYKAVNRVLTDFAELACKNPGMPYVLIIDEINRANLSSVLGELIYALEYRGHAVASMYAVKSNGDLGIESEDRRVILPDNLYIIGTMNTADRSAGHVDYAIRRRFAFIDVLPELITDKGFDDQLFITVRALFSIDDKYKVRSKHLTEEFRPRDVALGHSYFIGLKGNETRRRFAIEYEIKPILIEYLKDGVLKESAREIIEGLA